MVSSRIVEYVFFFGLLGVVAYIVWQLLAPFVSALALAAIIVTICYPLYERILRHTPKHNRSVASFITTIIVLLIVIFPLFFITYSLVSEATAVFSLLNDRQMGFEQTLVDLQETAQQYVPGLDLNITELLRQSAEWFTRNLGAIFAGTAATLFLFFIAMIGAFYFFRDGKEFTKWLVVISPLPDEEDEVILTRLARAVRSVATGTVLVALIQGTLTAVGLAIFGFDRAILWGSIASLGALIPSVGTSIVFIPAVGYLLVTGDYFNAIGVTVWGLTAVGLIDNLLGPYLMSRGNNQHPFVILLAVLGGIALFGPIGFIVGPVMISLFLVLLELYSQHIAKAE
ncbi:MAG: AI-2E family transporter [Patescibacteria group bacterium]